MVSRGRSSTLANEEWRTCAATAAEAGVRREHRAAEAAQERAREWAMAGTGWRTWTTALGGRTRWRQMARSEFGRAWQSLTSAARVDFFLSTARALFSLASASSISFTLSLPLSPSLSLSKMDDVFDGAVGIDLGTTYS